MVDILQYRPLTNCMYWFPVPTKLSIVIWPYSVESDIKPQINKSYFGKDWSETQGVGGGIREVQLITISSCILWFMYFFLFLIIITFKIIH